MNLRAPDLIPQGSCARGGPAQHDTLANLCLFWSDRASTASTDKVVCTEIAGLLVVESASEPLRPDAFQQYIRDSGLECVGIQAIQSGRESFHAEGDCRSFGPAELLIWTSERPFELTSIERHHKISVIVPWAELRERIPCAGVFRHAILDSRTGLGAVLRSHVETLAGQVDRLKGEDQSAIRRVTVELLTAAMTFHGDQARRFGLSHQYLLRLQSYIVDHLQEEQLSPLSIAKAHNISDRYLHHLFAQTGTSVSDFIREQRLQRCRDALTNPAYRSLSVAEIAHQWGFPAPAHFSRIFKRRFGLSPRDARCDGVAEAGGPAAGLAVSRNRVT